MSTESVWLIRDGRNGLWRWGRGRLLYLSLYCHHQNDSCIKMGSDESHFNVPLIVRDKVTRQCPETTTFEEKGEPKRIRTEVPRLTSLTPYHLAKPADFLFWRLRPYLWFWWFPLKGCDNSVGRASAWKVGSNILLWVQFLVWEEIFFLSKLSVQTLLQCLYSARMQSNVSAAVPTLKIASTGSHTIVWTHALAHRAQ